MLNRDIQIFVKLLTGPTVTIATKPLATVRSLFDRLEDRGVSIIGHRLLYGTKPLDNDRMLSDYGIQNESTLHAVFRLYGG
jgi:hypothetical protein